MKKLNVLFLAFAMIAMVGSSCNRGTSNETGMEEAFPTSTPDVQPIAGGTNSADISKSAGASMVSMDMILFCFVADGDVNSGNLPAKMIGNANLDNLYPNGMPNGYNWGFAPGTCSADGNVGALDDGTIFVTTAFVSPWATSLQIKTDQDNWNLRNGTQGEVNNKKCWLFKKP